MIEREKQMEDEAQLSKTMKAGCKPCKAETQEHERTHLPEGTGASTAYLAGGGVMLILHKNRKNNRVLLQYRLIMHTYIQKMGKK